jgi:hypothetical protein
MRQLLEDYKRRLKTINEELKTTIDEASDLTTITRLTIKRGCYRTFITELERIAPPVKPIDPKVIAEEKRIRDEKEKAYQEKQDDWNRRMEAGEFEPKEVKQPEGF